MKKDQKYVLSFVLAFVALLSGFALLPLALSAHAFSIALPWDLYASAYMSRCYVNQAATGGNNGISWQDAYVS